MTTTTTTIGAIDGDHGRAKRALGQSGRKGTKHHADETLLVDNRAALVDGARDFGCGGDDDDSDAGNDDDASPNGEDDDAGDDDTGVPDDDDDTGAPDDDDDNDNDDDSAGTAISVRC
jgi:hypothetical protein